MCFIGQVHDPLARDMNLGISGNAGIFTTAEDLAILCAALQNGGELNGTRILSPLAVKAMRTVPRDEAPLGRALGWDVYSDYASNLGNMFSPETYGHTGYTGTSVLIDPVNDISVILLTNRAHPDDAGAVVRLRTLVANAVAVAATAKGKFSAHPVKGNAGVYVFSVLDKTNRPGKFDEKLEQQKLRQRAMQYAGNFMNELYMKGNVVDNRYLFF